MAKMANRTAERAGTSKAVYSRTPFASPYSRNSINIIIPGATPKETTSARESRTLPTSDDAFSILAMKPSRKSKRAAIPIIQEAMIMSPEKRKMMDKQPERRLKSVSRFGNCFHILILFLQTIKILNFPFGSQTGLPINSFGRSLDIFINFAPVCILRN
jgi:hypothetical protein